MFRIVRDFGWANGLRSAAAFGRKLPLKFAGFGSNERPLLVKADAQPGTLEIELLSDRYAPESSRSA